MEKESLVLFSFALIGQANTEPLLLHINCSSSLHTDTQRPHQAPQRTPPGILRSLFIELPSEDEIMLTLLLVSTDVASSLLQG